MKNPAPPFRGPLLAAVALAASASLAGCAPVEEQVGDAEQAAMVCADGETLEGVDVSHWNGAIDWARVKADGRVFGIAKVTESLTFIDDEFPDNWDGMKQAGVIRGAYHFFRADDDPIAQADHYLSQITLEPGDLPPVLDLETDDGETGAVIADRAVQWLDYVAAATKMKPIVYTGPNFVNSTLENPAGFDTHAVLWVAHWGPDCPNVPAPFAGWSFWQYSSTGAVDGIDGNVDVNEFNGTLADLKAITVPVPSSSSSSGGGAGGAGGEGGSGGAGGGGEPSASEGGCSCEVVSSSPSGGGAATALSLVAISALRRRRSRRC